MQEQEEFLKPTKKQLLLVQLFGASTVPTNFLKGLMRCHKMRVYGYARVSTEEQVKSGSLNQQIDKIKDYCDRNDHQLLELFTDAGVSAIKERLEFESMMETISEDGASEEDIVKKG